MTYIFWNHYQLSIQLKIMGWKHYQNNYSLVLQNWSFFIHIFFFIIYLEMMFGTVNTCCHMSWKKILKRNLKMQHGSNKLFICIHYFLFYFCFLFNNFILDLQNEYLVNHESENASLVKVFFICISCFLFSCGRFAFYLY